MCFRTVPVLLSCEPRSPEVTCQLTLTQKLSKADFHAVFDRTIYLALFLGEIKLDHFGCLGWQVEQPLAIQGGVLVSTHHTGLQNRLRVSWKTLADPDGADGLREKSQKIRLGTLAWTRFAAILGRFFSFLAMDLLNSLHSC